MKRVWDSYSQNADDVLKEGLGAGFIGDFEEAVELFDRVNHLVIGYSDTKGEAWFYKALALSELGKSKEAFSMFKEYLEVEKKDDSAWNNLGEEYLESEKFEDAKNCFDKAIKLNSEVELFWENKAEALMELENFNEALKCTKKMLEINSKSVVSLLVQADIYDQLNEKDKLKEVLKKIIQISPSKDPNLLGAIGLAFLFQDDFENALASVEKGLKLDPSDELLWYNKACILSRLNKHEEALDSLLVATSIEPENLVAMRDEKDLENIKNTERYNNLFKIPV